MTKYETRVIFTCTYNGRQNYLPTPVTTDIPSRIPKLQMLETPNHHWCIRYYDSLILRYITGFLFTFLIDMSLKKKQHPCFTAFQNYSPRKKSDIFFHLEFGLKEIPIFPLLFRQLRTVLVEIISTKLINVSFSSIHHLQYKWTLVGKTNESNLLEIHSNWSRVLLE